MMAHLHPAADSSTSELAKNIKRPLSAYMIFSRDEREHLKNGPKLSFVEVTKFISQRWASIDENVKNGYLKLAEMDKQRFQRELAQAGLTGLKRAPKKIKKNEKKRGRGRAVRPPGCPKKPLSSFLLFSQEKRAGVRSELETGETTISVAVVGKRLGQMWNESSEEVKNRYKMLAAVEKKRYEREMEEFQNQFDFGATNSSDDMSYSHDHLGHYTHAH